MEAQTRVYEVDFTARGDVPRFQVTTRPGSRDPNALPVGWLALGLLGVLLLLRKR